MSSAGPDRLRETQESLTNLIQTWVAVVVEEDKSPETITDVLGSLQAMKEIARRIASTELRIGRVERQRDQLRAKLNTLGPAESNRVKERMDTLQAQIERLETKRSTLIENLSSLSALLQVGAE